MAILLSGLWAAPVSEGRGSPRKTEATQIGVAFFLSVALLGGVT